MAEDGRQGEVRHYGVIPGDLEGVAKVLRALRAPDRVLHCVYEAATSRRSVDYEDYH